MKDTIRMTAMSLALAATMATAMYLPSKSVTVPTTLTTEEISWIEFCRHKGYDIHSDDEEILIEYLDCWCGSTVEEEALLPHGAEA